MRRWLVLGAALTLLGAGCDGDSSADGGASRDAGGIDASVVDAGSVDASVADASSFDAATADAGATDAGGDDAAIADAGAADAGTTDAGDPLQGGETCALAVDVTAGGTFSGSTEGAEDDYGPDGPGCPFSAVSGADVTYFVRPTAATRYRVTVEPTDATFDPMLYAVTTCGGSGCEAGTILNGPGQMEQITLDVAADETVFIVVDGELLSEGAFELRVVIE